MQISSGLQGLHNAQSGLTQATIDVAKNRPSTNTPLPEPSALDTTTVASEGTAALIAADAALRLGEAAANVIAVGSETIGTIIDIKV
ncbi:MAG: chemotaxis protein [Shewanella sp.]|uniref:chemotaxis protein n=1 Tax=Shewanella sp. TaxID=50422 RepID=UPI003F30DD0F